MWFHTFERVLWIIILLLLLYVLCLLFLVEVFSSADILFHEWLPRLVILFREPLWLAYFFENTFGFYPCLSELAFDSYSGSLNQIKRDEHSMYWDVLRLILMSTPGTPLNPKQEGLLSWLCTNSSQNSCIWGTWSMMWSLKLLIL